MKTASTLSVLFPGAGHFYSGQTGKGALFTGLELAAFAGIAMSSSNYFIKVDEYDTWESNKVGSSWSISEGEQLVQAKNEALYPLLGSCTAAGIVWLWNIRDINKTASNKYSEAHSVSIGVNTRGQIEAYISF